jgi:hypothetical protein
VLEAYAGELSEIAGRLGELEPPPILKHAHSDRVERLERIEQVAAELAEALRGGGGSVASLLTEFRNATGSGPAPGIDDRSVREYRRRYSQIRRVAAKLRRAEQRTRRKLAEEG